MLPRIFGPYEPLRRDYPMSEYLADIAGAGVVKSVYVQANWAPAQAEDEVAWVQKTADETGWPHAIVGYADLLAGDVRPALDRLKRYRLLRGVRMQLHWHENPQYRFAKAPDVADDPAFRRNFAALADYGLAFDLQVFAPQMDGAARLAARFSEDHLHPAARRHARGPLRGGQGRLARRHAASSRRSRTSTRSFPASAPSSTATIPPTSPGSCARRSAFSVPRRCLFGSNFPIEKLWTDFAALAGAYREAAALYSPEEQADMLHDVAARVYGIA